MVVGIGIIIPIIIGWVGLVGFGGCWGGGRGLGSYVWNICFNENIMDYRSYGDINIGSHYF